MKLNQELPKVLGLTAPVDLDSIKLCFHKALRFEEALEAVEQPIRRVIMQMSRGLQHRHRYTLVDVKVREHKLGDCTCIPGWHLDSVTDPRHNSQPENHIIWTQGEPTEFLRNPIDFPEHFAHFSQVLDAIPSDNIFKINSNTIYQYGRFHLHRGPIVQENQRRVLIRITETDVVKPTPYKPK